ncbi:hypothetical protein Tco_1095186 [Tanacetum coccineum]
MFGVHDLDGDEVVVKHMDASAGEKEFVAKQSEKVVEEVVSATEVSAATITEDEMTLAQALAELKKKEEANAALIAQWNDIQDKVETDYELAQRLTVLVEESSKKVEAEIAQESSSKRAGEELE